MTVLREKQSNDNLAQAYNEGEQYAMSSNVGYDAEVMEDPYNPLYYNRSPRYGQEEVNTSTMTAPQLRHDYPSSETISVKLDSTMVEETRKDSPVAENMPEDSPIADDMPKDSSIVEDTHNESPMVDDTCKDSSITEDMPKDSPIAEHSPIAENSPIADHMPQDAPVAEDIPKYSPIAEDTRKDSPIAEDMREDSPLVEDALQNLKVAEDTRKESPFVQDMHEVSLAEDTRKDLPIVMVNSLIVEDIPPVAEDMREHLPIVGTPKDSPVVEAMPTASPIAEHVSPITKNTSPIAQGSSPPAQYTRKVPTTFEEILPAHKILTWEELDEQEKQKRKNRSFSGIVARHAQKFGGQIKRFTEKQKSKQY